MGRHQQCQPKNFLQITNRTSIPEFQPLFSHLAADVFFFGLILIEKRKVKVDACLIVKMSFFYFSEMHSKQSFYV